MSKDSKHNKDDDFKLLKKGSKARRGKIGSRLRNYFLTGLVIAAPISITVFITWWFVDLIDTWFKPLVPAAYNPETYLPFAVPGVGLLFAVIMLMVLGALTANLFGRTVVGLGERFMDNMPLVRNLYKALKQRNCCFSKQLVLSGRWFNPVPAPGIICPGVHLDPDHRRGCHACRT